MNLDVDLDEEKCRSAFPSDIVEIDPQALTESGLLDGALRPVEETITDMARWMKAEGA